MSGSTAKDWKLLGPFSGCDAAQCLAEWDCVDLTAAAEQFAAFTRNYCGVGSRRKLHSISENNPPDNTLTLQGVDEFVGSVIRDFAKGGCITSLQRVHCSGRGEAYRLVQFSSITPQGRLTANGPGATDDDQISNVEAAYFDKFVWGAPAQSVPMSILNNTGMYKGEAPLGDVDGENTVFTIDPMPNSTFPITVYVDTVEQVEGVDYTVSNGVITFAIAPICNAEIGVDFYTDEFILLGLEPVAVWFCGARQCVVGSACGGECNDGCNRMHALYNTSILVTDGCGNTLGNRVALATYNYSSSRDQSGITLMDVTLLDQSVLNATDGLCTGSGETFIATQRGIYMSCGDSFIKESVALPAGKSIGKLAYSELTGDMYALFGDSGVFRKFPTGWRAVLRDGQLTVGQQTSIAAAGMAVITGGELGSAQTSLDSGAQWSARQLPVTSDIYDVAVGVPNELSQAAATFFALAHNPMAQTPVITLYGSTNGGAYWASKKQWSGVIKHGADINVAVDDWFLYVRIDGKVYRNTNKGCDKCEAWAEISNSAASARSKLGVCSNDPSRSALVGVGGTVALAGDNFYTMSEEETVIQPILDNDIVPDDCQIDVTSVVITTPPTQGTATVNPDGTVTYVSNLGATGTDEYQYSVDYLCEDGTTGTISAGVYVSFFA